MKTNFRHIASMITGTALCLVVVAGVQRSVNAAPQSVTPATSARVKNEFEDREFILNNGDPATMMYFYASPSDVDSWEEDILGDSVVGPDESILIEIEDGRETCIYDFRAVFDDDSVSEDYEIDICELTEYTFN